MKSISGDSPFKFQTRCWVNRLSVFLVSGVEGIQYSPPWGGGGVRVPVWLFGVKYYWNANISLGKIRNISYIPSPPSTLSVFLPLYLIYSTNIQRLIRWKRNLDKCDGCTIKCTDRYNTLHGVTRKSKEWHAFLLLDTLVPCTKWTCKLSSYDLR